MSQLDPREMHFLFGAGTWIVFWLRLWLRNSQRNSIWLRLCYNICSKIPTTQIICTVLWHLHRFTFYTCPHTFFCDCFMHLIKKHGSHPLWITTHIGTDGQLWVGREKDTPNSPQEGICDAVDWIITPGLYNGVHWSSCLIHQDLWLLLLFLF